ncbi:hypothetical protein PISMIDRAFT_673660, partial [Pisolithus microcarpus 441]
MTVIPIVPYLSEAIAGLCWSRGGVPLRACAALVSMAFTLLGHLLCCLLTTLFFLSRIPVKHAQSLILPSHSH